MEGKAEDWTGERLLGRLLSKGIDLAPKRSPMMTANIPLADSPATTSKGPLIAISGRANQQIYDER